MNKTIAGILITTLAWLASNAWGLSYEEWDAYCKKNERNQERCVTANRLCEQIDGVDCDKIRTAFMLEQPIPTSVIPNNSTD
jgi:hypothetical protein